MSDTKTGDAEAIIEFAKEHAEVKRLTDQDYHEVFAVPHGFRIETVDLEPFGARPARKRGKVTLHTGDAFAGYVNHHKISDATALYADVEARRIVAVLDDHISGDTSAGWGEHRAVLALRHTPEWKAWADRNGRLMSQVQFAEHVEDNILDIVEPAGADLLELAQTFQATTKVAFKSSQRLSSGEQQLTYVEEVDAKAGAKGDIVIPAEFVLALAPFEGCDTYRVTARLRYRINGGELAIGYVLNRPEDVVRDAFDQILVGVESTVELTAYRGAEPTDTR